MVGAEEWVWDLGAEGILGMVYFENYWFIGRQRWVKMIEMKFLKILRSSLRRKVLKIIMVSLDLNAKETRNKKLSAGIIKKQ